MVSRKTKFSISIEKLQIDFEGSQEVGQQIQQGVQQAIGGLMNTQARLLAMKDEGSSVLESKVLDAPASQDNGQNGHVDTDSNPDKSKQPRQRKARGGSLIGLLRSLKQEKFFAQGRRVAEIKDRLQDKGHIYTDSKISARLQDLIKKDELFRDKSGEDGVYVYKDSRFDESPGSPGPAKQSPQ